MSYTQEKIYNLALSHLLLSQQVTEISTDTITNEVRVLNTFWHEALNITLQDLDLDSLSEPITLELLATLDNDPWAFAYRYPAKCSFLRRLKSNAVVDTNRTHISKRTGMRDGLKVIFTNEADAVAECIPSDIPLEFVDYSAGLTISYFLAFLSAPLIVGKGAKKLREEIIAGYVLAKSKAQEIDARENFNYDAPWERSDFVAARLE